MRELTWFERAFLKSSRGFAEFGLGYAIDFDEEMVRQHGITGYITKGLKAQRIQAQLIKVLGYDNMHLVAAFASFFNGCDYCTWGHLYALNLIHFEKTGELYPVDEIEALPLMQRGDSQVMAELERRLEKFPEHLRLIKRQAELRDGAEAKSDEDRALNLSVGLFEWVNECSITVAAPAPPMGAIAKKKDLIAKYQAARAPLRQQQK